MRTRTAALLAGLALASSGCGAIVGAGLQAESVEANKAVVEEANRRVHGGLGQAVGRIPAPTGDCDLDAAGVTQVMTTVGARSALGADEQVALTRLEGLVASCGGQVDAGLRAAFDAG